VEEGLDEVAEWARALGRDPRAFEAIFDRHEGRVFRHALHLTDSFHDAEEVTAATFFELWRRRDRVRLVEGSTLPWLLVAATNISRNSRRALRRYRVVLDRLRRDGAIEPEPSDLLFGSGLEDNEDLYRALRGLPAKDVSLLVLNAVDGLSVKDAASVLGITDGAGRVRLHRAKRRLRDQLAGPTEFAIEGDDGRW
jgi:RNA polymerase sigma factor (sigma-70 family)